MGAHDGAGHRVDHGLAAPGKAGVGSAMNDTTRQVGGALGVAIIGSVFASAYTSSIASALQGLPAQAVSAATNSVGAALAIADRLPGASGTALATAAKSSFIHAMDRGLFVGAAVAVVGALVALIWLPNRPLTEPEAIVLERESRPGHEYEGTVTERAER